MTTLVQRQELFNSLIGFSEKSELKGVIARCRKNYKGKSFTNNPSPYTPNRVCRRILDKVCRRIKTTDSIVVFFTVEFAVELYKREYKDVVVVTKEFCSETKKITETMGYKYMIIEEVKSMSKKFSVGVTNPPYKQGLFRNIMLDLLENIIEDDGILVQISPDETLPTNNKNQKTLPAMKKYGLQEIEDCADDFPNEITSAPIVTYYFDKSKDYNPSAFEKELTEKDKLTLSIIEKIQRKQEYGTLSSATTGELDRKSEEEVNALVGVYKTGPKYEMLPRSKTRFIADSGDYMFTNMFIGINKEDCVVKGSGPMYISEKNIYSIGNTKIFTEDDFVEIYLHPTMRFFLKFLRGNNQRTLCLHLRQLPLISPKTDVNSYLELTKEEIEHINNELG